MIHRRQYREARWIDAVNPTRQELNGLADEFRFHSTVVEELTSPSLKSRVELYDQYLFLILHFPAVKLSHRDSIQEIDFVIGRDFVVTVRYDTVDAIDTFAKILEVKSILDRGPREHPAGYIFFGIIQEIYHSLLSELEYVGNWIAKIEEGIFAGREREMVMALSEVSRTLLNFKKATDFHKEILTSLHDLGKKVFDENFSYHVERLLDEYHKIRHVLNGDIDSVAELRETNNSLLSSKQNEVMKVLTIVAFIALPLSLITSLLQIDTVARPIVGRPNDFWIILAAMGALGVLLFAYFKHKKWL